MAVAAQAGLPSEPLAGGSAQLSVHLESSWHHGCLIWSYLQFILDIPQSCYYRIRIYLHLPIYTSLGVFLPTFGLLNFGHELSPTFLLGTGLPLVKHPQQS